MIKIIASPLVSVYPMHGDLGFGGFLNRSVQKECSWGGVEQNGLHVELLGAIASHFSSERMAREIDSAFRKGVLDVSHKSSGFFESLAEFPIYHRVYIAHQIFLIESRSSDGDTNPVSLILLASIFLVDVLIGLAMKDGRIIVCELLHNFPPVELVRNGVVLFDSIIVDVGSKCGRSPLEGSLPELFVFGILGISNVRNAIEYCANSVLQFELGLQSSHPLSKTLEPSPKNLLQNGRNEGTS